MDSPWRRVRSRRRLGHSFPGSPGAPRRGNLRNDRKWAARLSAPLVAVAVSGGFFGMAFLPRILHNRFRDGGGDSSKESLYVFRWLIYRGALGRMVSLILTRVGLLVNRRIDTVD